MKLLYSVFALLFITSSALAQTGWLHGLITDQNGAAFAGAKVTVNGAVIAGRVAFQSTVYDDISLREVSLKSWWNVHIAAIERSLKPTPPTIAGRS